jgi:hypothetical protein
VIKSYDIMLSALTNGLAARKWVPRSLACRMKAYLSQMRASLARWWHLLLFAFLLFPQFFTLRGIASPLLNALANRGWEGWFFLLALHVGGIALAITQERALTGGPLGVYMRTLPLTEKMHWRGTLLVLSVANAPLWAYLIVCFALGGSSADESPWLGAQLLILGQSVLLTQASWLHAGRGWAFFGATAGAAVPLILGHVGHFGEHFLGGHWLGPSMVLAMALLLRGSERWLLQTRKGGDNASASGLQKASKRYARFFPGIAWPVGWRIVHQAMYRSHRGFTFQRLLLAALPPCLAVMIIQAGGAAGQERGLAVIATGAMAWPLGALFKQLRANRGLLDIYFCSLPMRVPFFWARTEIGCVALLTAIVQVPFLFLMMREGVLGSLDIPVIWAAFLGMLLWLWALARLDGGMYVVLLATSVWPWSVLVMVTLP